MDCDERDHNLDISHGRCKIFHSGDDTPAVALAESHAISIFVTVTFTIPVANPDANADANADTNCDTDAQANCDADA
jgi:hypothetical protein